MTMYMRFHLCNIIFILDDGRLRYQSKLSIIIKLVLISFIKLLINAPKNDVLWLDYRPLSYCSVGFDLSSLKSK